MANNKSNNADGSNGPGPNGPLPTILLTIGVTDPDCLPVVGLKIEHPLIDDELNPYVTMDPETALDIAQALVKAVDALRRSVTITRIMRDVLMGRDGGEEGREERKTDG